MAKEVKKKITAIGVGTLLAGGLIGAGITDISDNSEQKINNLQEDIVKLSAGNAELMQEIEVHKQKIAELESLEPEVVTEEVEVLVEDARYQEVFDYFLEADSDEEIDAILDDVEDDEIDLIHERVVKLKEMKTLAAKYFEDELADALDKEVYDDIKIDEDDVEKIRVDDDYDEIRLVSYDWDDLDFEFELTADAEHDDEDFEVVGLVEVENGEAEDLEILEFTWE